MRETPSTSKSVNTSALSDLWKSVCKGSSISRNRVRDIQEQAQVYLGLIKERYRSGRSMQGVCRESIESGTVKLCHGSCLGRAANRRLLSRID